jgi:hypothetical protein
MALAARGAFRTKTCGQQTAILEIDVHLESGHVPALKFVRPL